MQRSGMKRCRAQQDRASGTLDAAFPNHIDSTAALYKPALEADMYVAGERGSIRLDR